MNVRTRHPHDYTKTQTRLLAGIASRSPEPSSTRAASASWRSRQPVQTLSEVSQALTSNMYLDLLYIRANAKKSIST